MFLNLTSTPKIVPKGPKKSPEGPKRGPKYGRIKKKIGLYFQNKNFYSALLGSKNAFET